MEEDKLKQWLEFAQKYQSEGFWSQILNEKNEHSSKNSFSVLKEHDPKCDLFEVDGELIIEIEIPGLSMEEVHVSINQKTLTISGEFKALQPKRKYYLKERSNRKFIKELPLPFPILLNQSTRELNKGILTLRLQAIKDESENIPL